MFSRIRIPMLILCAFLAVAGYGQTVSVQVDTRSLEPGTAGFLRILCTSDTPLSGLRIPLRVGGSADIVIDSVSFQNTVAIGNFRLVSQITDGSREGFVSVIPNISSRIPTFPAGTGEICRIYCHTSIYAGDVYVPVDTFYHVYQIGNQTVYDVLEASDALGLSAIYPSFTAGGVEISRSPLPVEDEEAGIPDRFSLGQNFPNPFNPSTQIVFSLRQSDDIRLDVYDIVGHHVTTLAQGRFPAGEHVVFWDAASQPSGVYFYRLTAGSDVLTRKMLLVK